MAKKFVLLACLGALAACGGGGSSTSSTPVTTTPPTPAVGITATGQGNLVLHPSLAAAYTYTLETPIRIRETGGGTADWNFARFSVIKGGREIERGEVGSDTIRSAGYSRITASSDKTYNVFFRFNSTDFDDLRVTLGFADLKDARQFTVDVVDNWGDVTISLTPAAFPAGTVAPR
jgi:hypothetical protein